MAGDTSGLTRSATFTFAFEGGAQLRVNPEPVEGLTKGLDYIRFFCYILEIN